MNSQQTYFLYNVFQLCDSNSSKWFNISLPKTAVLVARKLFKIWSYAPAATQSCIAARNASVHTGPNTNLFAIKMNKFWQISQRKKLIPIVISFPLYIWKLNSGNYVSQPLFHPPPHFLNASLLFCSIPPSVLTTKDTIKVIALVLSDLSMNIRGSSVTSVKFFKF